MLQFRKKTDGAGVAVKKPLKVRLAGKGKVIAGICLAVVLAVFFLSPKDAPAPRSSSTWTWRTASPPPALWRARRA